MFLDNEIDAVNYIMHGLDHYNVLQYDGNSFNKKIFMYVKNLDKFIENNGHDALPPDFYSDEFSCMFDVMRVNDSEIKKSYNPVKMRERQAEKDIKESGILNAMSSNPTIIINSESDNDNEHTLKNYIKNSNRVMSEHIKKINIWKSEHPNIKHKGLLIFDETESYFEGYVQHVYADQYVFAWDANKPLVLHKPWMDATFVKKAYDSELDFVIWFCPYKSHGSLWQKTHYDYPELVILDTRFPRTSYIQYDISKFERM